MRPLPIPTLQSAARFISKVGITENCWEWLAAKNNKGYGVFSQTSKFRSLYAHRFSYRLFFGAIPERCLVLHSCDNPCCVNPQHLHLGDHSKNHLEMYSRERAGYALTLGEVRKIRQLRIAGLTYEKIREQIGCSMGTVSNVLTGKVFGWVQ